MTFIRMTVEGVKEAQEALVDLKTGFPKEVWVALEAGMQPIAKEMKTYPPQPPYMGMQRYGSAKPTYRRTMNYGQRITTLVRRQGASEITGIINSAASYSTYLRGDLDGYQGAWMHRGIWQTLKGIVDRLWPQAQQRIEQQISNLLRRLDLGE